MRTSKAGRTDQAGTSWKSFLLSWRGALYLGLPLVALLASGILAAQKLVQPPPSTIRILSGPDGSSYRLNAEKYKKIIEHYGVKVVILPSHGSLDNLHQLANRKRKPTWGSCRADLPTAWTSLIWFRLVRFSPSP
jgi:hypothetical protein